MNQTICEISKQAIMPFIGDVLFSALSFFKPVDDPSKTPETCHRQNAHQSEFPDKLR